MMFSKLNILILYLSILSDILAIPGHMLNILKKHEKRLLSVTLVIMLHYTILDLITMHITFIIFVAVALSLFHYKSPISGYVNMYRSNMSRHQIQPRRFQKQLKFCCRNIDNNEEEIRKNVSSRRIIFTMIVLIFSVMLFDYLNIKLLKTVTMFYGIVFADIIFSKYAPDNVELDDGALVEIMLNLFVYVNSLFKLWLMGVSREELKVQYKDR